MRKQTWFAIVVCVLGIVPGFIGGALLSVLYKAWIMSDWGYNPDVLWLRTLFGFEAPGQVLRWLLFSAIPEWVHGVAAGLIAVWITWAAYTGSRLELAAYVTAALFGGALITLLAIALIMMGPTMAELDSTIQIVGLALGLAMGVHHFAEGSPHQYR